MKRQVYQVISTVTLVSFLSFSVAYATPLPTESTSRQAAGSSSEELQNRQAAQSNQIENKNATLDAARHIDKVVSTEVINGQSVQSRYFVESYKDENGVLVPWRVWKKGSNEVYAVVGHADILTPGEFDDILLDPVQQVGDYKVVYSKTAQGYGLTIKKGREKTFVDFPSVKEVTLDGKKYDISVNHAQVSFIEQQVHHEPEHGGSEDQTPPITQPEPQPTLPVEHEMPEGAIEVNQAWISAHLTEGALFLEEAGKTYFFTTDFEAEGTAIFIMRDNITVDLNGHTIRFGSADRDGSMGINAFRARSASGAGSDDQNYSKTAEGWTHSPNGAVIQNGEIIWAGQNASWAAAIGGSYADGHVTISNMRLESGGRDGACVNFNWTEVTVHDTYMLNHSESTADRHTGPATLNANAKMAAYNNIIIGGRMAINAGSNSEIYNNVLRQAGFATNGYGVGFYRMNDSKVYDNIIVPSNGRGIIFNAGENNEAYGNLIVVHERPNAEYPDALNAAGIRVRYDAVNNSIHDNQILAIGGGENLAASGLYLSDYPDGNNHYENNTVRAILTSPENISQYANAITMESQGTAQKASNDIIQGNDFASNNYLVRLSGYDSGCYQEAIVDNSLNWVSGMDSYNWLVNALNDPKYNFNYDASNSYVKNDVKNQLLNEVKQEVLGLVGAAPNNQNRETFYTGYHGESVITLIDTRAGSSVGMRPEDVYVGRTDQGVIDIRVGHSVDVVAKTSSGQVLANKTITVTDNTGNVYSGVTDSQGKATLNVIDYSLYKSPAGTSVSQQNRSGQSARIDGYLGVSLASTLNLSAPLVLSFVPA